MLVGLLMMAWSDAFTVSRLTNRWKAGLGWARRSLERHRDESGGAEEDRTPDLCIANAALSQLSYGPTAPILVYRAGG